ncbi:MAG: multidrug efflux SMR transporter [Chloroflexaceae bacterium]|nr:multidrug efflux SMR transporter [Chloroflexaceae bacterium]
MNHGLFLLLLAILCEVVATTSLKASDGFTRPLPVALVIGGYGMAFYLFSLSLKTQIPLGTAYAIWSGLGTAGAITAGLLIWHEKLDAWRVVGLALIIIGVVLVAPRKS